MAKLRSDKLAQIHSDALAEFDDIQAAYRDERIQCLEDRRFYSISGAQWEGPLGEQYENKPRFEFNKVHLAVIRIFNEYRNNRITVDFQTRDGSKADQLADTCDGLYRADERASNADEAYDNAFEEGVGGGMGAIRITTCYENEHDDEDTRQRVRMEPIFDADSCVFYDLNAKRQDKADAKRCYVFTPYSRAEYKEEFGDDPNDWPKTIQRTEFDWAEPDVVWVAELYRVEETTELINFFRGLDDTEMKVPQSELDEDENKLAELTATGFRLVRQKRVKRKKVRKLIMSGGKVLEDCGHIAGDCIPIVPFYAKRWVVDGIERCMGHVRLAKDAQRLINSLYSWLADMAGRFDVEKPILTPEQIAGHAEMWAEDNVKRYPYLLINPVTGADGNPMPAAPVAYTKAPNLPPMMAALAQIAEQALSDMLGNQQAGEKLQANISGKAVELIQNRLDMQAYIYLDNFSKTMRRCGEVWLSMMKDIVVEEERTMRALGPDNEASPVVMNRRVWNEEAGQEEIENDMSKADYLVDVDVGPSSSSRRAATVKALTGMMQMTSDPETQAVLTAMAMMNMEGEGIGDVRSYFRNKLIRLGAVKPTEDEAQQLAAEMQNQQPDAQTVYLQKAGEAEEARAAKARADTVETIAAAELKRAQTVKTMGEAQALGITSALDVTEAMRRAALPPTPESPMIGEEPPEAPELEMPEAEGEDD